MPVLGHIDQRLSDVSIKFNQSNFAIQEFFPEVPVNKQSDVFTTFDKNNTFQVDDDTMSANGDAKQIMYGTGTDNYKCQDRALKGFVTQEERENADDPLSPEVELTETLTERILLAREIRGYNLIKTISNTSSPGTKWTFSAGTPVTDIEAAILAMWRPPNIIGFSQNAWSKFKYNAEAIAKIGGGFQGLKRITPEMAADLFQVDKVIIAQARKSSTKAKNAASISYVWEKSVVLAYVEARPTLKSASFGKLMAQRLEVVEGAPAATFRLRRYGDPTKGIGGRELFQVEHRSVEKIVAADHAYILTDVVA